MLLSIEEVCLPRFRVSLLILHTFGRFSLSREHTRLQGDDN